MTTVCFNVKRFDIVVGQSFQMTHAGRFENTSFFVKLTIGCALDFFALIDSSAWNLQRCVWIFRFAENEQLSVPCGINQNFINLL